MLRIRFTERDLAGVVFSTGDHAETLGSVRALYAGGPGGALAQWRSRTERRISADMLPLLDVVGRSGPVPDFLSPERLSGGPSPQVAGMLHTIPAAVVADDLQRSDRTGSAWLRRLAAGDRTAVRQLQAALVAYHATCVDAVLPAVRAAVLTELGRQARLMLSGGLAAVLAGLGSGIRWRQPTLEVPGPLRGEVDLGGRGLRLVPSVLWPRVGFVQAGYRRPTLVYPMRPPDALPDVPPDGAGSSRPLAALLGRTRAEILAALTTPAGTVQLAERVGVGWSTASEHTAALRAAGLVATRRRGRAVQHSLTTLGTQLLAGDSFGG